MRSLLFALGGDYRISPSFGVGPFAAMSFGKYVNLSNDLISSAAIPKTEIHEWLTFGVRGVFDLLQ